MLYRLLVIEHQLYASGHTRLVRPLSRVITHLVLNTRAGVCDA